MKYVVAIRSQKSLRFNRFDRRFAYAKLTHSHTLLRIIQFVTFRSCLWRFIVRYLFPCSRVSLLFCICFLANRFKARRREKTRHTSRLLSFARSIPFLSADCRGRCSISVKYKFWARVDESARHNRFAASRFFPIWKYEILRCVFGFSFFYTFIAFKPIGVHT